MSVIRWSSSPTFTSTTDGSMYQLRVGGDIIVPSGVTLTTSNRCKGLLIECNNLYLYGTISMSSRGAYAAGNNVGIEAFSDRNYITYDGIGWGSLPTCRKIPSAGASGGGGGSVVDGGKFGASDVGDPGNAGTDGQTGGGGGGGAAATQQNSGAYGGGGNTGTAYSGGAAGGGAYAVGGQGNVYGGGGEANGGAGGAGASQGGAAGSGAGNPSGGTGGLLILIIKGMLYIHSSGIISADGADGGVGTACGGGSGGGSVNILYGTINNNGTVQANGGLGGVGTLLAAGGNGGAGSVRLNSLRTT